MAVVVVVVVVALLVVVPRPKSLSINPGPLGFLVVVVLVVVLGRLVVVVKPMLATVEILQLLNVWVHNEATLQSPLISKGPQSYLVVVWVSALLM